jgi:hypothetical protein
MDDKSGCSKHFRRDKLSVLPPLDMVDITTLEASTACCGDSFIFFTFHPAHFDPEGGGSVYLRNACNIAHISTV